MSFTLAPKVLQNIVNHVIDVEGGYVDHPADPGGKTMYGITEAVARTYGYKGVIKDLPKSLAQEIYYSIYILDTKFNQVMDIAGLEVATELIDAGINCGVSRAATWLQRTLNAFNNNGKLYPPLKEDGSLGAVSLKALRTLVEARGKSAGTVIAKACNCMQGMHYITLTEKDPKFKAFIYGWISNRC